MTREDTAVAMTTLANSHKITRGKRTFVGTRLVFYRISKGQKEIKISGACGMIFSSYSVNTESVD